MKNVPYSVWMLIVENSYWYLQKKKHKNYQVTKNFAQPRPPKSGHYSQKNHYSRTAGTWRFPFSGSSTQTMQLLNA